MGIIHSLLSTFNIPCLSSRRTIAKLILLHKFIYKQMYIPENFFSFHHQLSHNLRSCHPLNLDYTHSPKPLPPSTLFSLAPLHFGTLFLPLQNPSTPQMNSNPTYLPSLSVNFNHFWLLICDYSIIHTHNIILVISSFKVFRHSQY